MMLMMTMIIAVIIIFRTLYTICCQKILNILCKMKSYTFDEKQENIQILNIIHNDAEREPDLLLIVIEIYSKAHIVLVNLVSMGNFSRKITVGGGGEEARHSAVPLSHPAQRHAAFIRISPLQRRAPLPGTQGEAGPLCPTLTQPLPNERGLPCTLWLR